MIKISGVTVSHINDCMEISGYINDDRIYSRVPDKFSLNLKAEWLIAVALLEAMYTNQSICVDSDIPISKKLLESLGELQLIYSCWNPDLRVVDIDASVSDSCEPYEFVGSFFSAGVDSSHTLMRHIDELSHLVMFRCFDFGNDQSSWESRLDLQSDFAGSIGKKIIPVETNVRDWADEKGISWEFIHGLFLSSIGGIFGMKRMYIPSSHTYAELFPWGSHPLSDPKWSTESTTVVHDGAGFRRGAKMKDLLSKPLLADNLQVCWRSTYTNCGQCPKCVRTMVAIKLLGGEAKSLPPLVNIKGLKVLKATDESGATFLEDAMVLANNAGNLEVYKLLRRYYCRFKISLILPLIDRYLFGNFFRHIYRRLFKPNWLNYRVTLHGHNRSGM